MLCLEWYSETTDGCILCAVTNCTTVIGFYDNVDFPENIGEAGGPSAFHLVVVLVRLG